MMTPIEAPAIDLETLWNRYCCQLEAFICSRVSDQADAQDILQDVFLRIHTHLCCLRNWERLESWIYQVTRNAIIDHYRRRRETVELSETLAADEDFEAEDAAARLAPSLREMVEGLPEPYRQALLLTEYQGLNQRQLAERLGLSFSGAKSRVQRARNKIRDMLLTCCHFELDRRGAIIDYYARCCCCADSSPGEQSARLRIYAP